MTRAPLAALALASTIASTLAAGPAVAASPAAPPDRSRAAPLRETLPGGLELIVLPVPGARTASMRVVVRAGSAMDPHGKDGLAHILEHLLARGGEGARHLVEDARAQGGTVNAFTARDFMGFELDAPAAAFEPLAERYLRAITSPELEETAVQVELGVVGIEDDYQFGGSPVWSLLEEVLFRERAIEAQSTVIGEATTRERISRADLVAWFQRHFATSAMTVILAGPIGAEQARALLDRAFLLPPALPTERVTPRTSSPGLPVTEKIRAPFLAAIFGYRIDEADRPACRALARVLDLRLTLALTVREPLLRGVEVACHEVHGNTFLLASGYARTLEASDLPSLLERTFKKATEEPPQGRERRVLEQRLARLADRARSDPAELADAAVPLAVLPREEGGVSELPFSTPPVLPLKAMQAAARRSFVPERRVLVFISPFEG